MLVSDSIAPAIVYEYPRLNDAQLQIIGHSEGPLLVIAGPGSGKTFSLVLRGLNLLLLGKAKPAELLMCTFTEKAAFELRDRMAAAARKVGYHADLTDLRVGTIHAICNRLIQEHRHRTPLGNGYEVLDDLSQLLFMFEHFDTIVGDHAEAPYLGRWNTKWRAIEGLRDYFNKMAEELVDAAKVMSAANSFLVSLGRAYAHYREALLAQNRVDFAHQQRIVHDLLADPAVGPVITRQNRYVLVDEYQDTNYVQEQILTTLAGDAQNICVVGDEDQSLYRFRGATVRNLLEFPRLYPGCRTINLTVNYRSHERVVRAYDRWMASADWSNPDPTQPPFRFEKTISPDPDTTHPAYPAIFAIWGTSKSDEARRFADLVAYLKSERVIEDYSQVALLLHSVRSEHSDPYIEALETKGIRAYCPRARAYFDNEEVRLLIGCFALIFGYYGDGRGSLSGAALKELAAYIDSCLIELAKRFAPPHPLAGKLREFAAQIQSLRGRDALDTRPADYLFRLLAYEPFTSLLGNENRARHLAIFSQLLNAFQNYYHYTVVTARNREFLRFHLFNSFLRLLHEGGINEYEDPDQPFPAGYVQIMTIHQAKGLEFPVVVVGSLDVQLSTAKRVDRDLQSFYRRPPFEPEKRITEFDRMRLHYVAFSRPEKVLVLTSGEAPKDYFGPIWDGLPQWPYVRRDVLGAQRFAIKDRVPVKKRFSFTGDLMVYETCPRQYQYFRHFDFTPSRSAVIFFGLLVHETIEEIHRIVLDGRLATLDEDRIRGIFDRTFYFLSLADVRPIGDRAREAAFGQVINYFRQNKDEMTRVIETEVDVSVEKDDYVLTGKVDLLLGGDGKLEILDFKTSERPGHSPALLARYHRQLCTYAHILERRYGKHADRLLLYWTAEPNKSDALMELPYLPELVERAGEEFDEVVSKISCGNFDIVTPPERKICKECDLKSLCAGEGIIPAFDDSEVLPLVTL